MMSKKRLKNGIAMLIIYALACYVVQTENSVLSVFLTKKTSQRESDKSIGVIDNSTLTKTSSQIESDKSIVVIDNSTLTKTSSQRESDKSIVVIDNSTLTIDWKSYRLGDVVLHRNYEKHYPGSIAAEYLHFTNLSYGRNRRYHKDDFCNIVRQRRNPQKSPDSGDFVVHLRLGDVLDNNIQPDEIEDVFHYGVSIVPLQIRNMINRNNTLGWWHYVKSKCYYSAVLAQLPPNTINRVVIVGSAIHNKEKPTNNNSVMYCGLVQRFFEAEGYSVSLRPDAPPDDDIIYMSHAFTFVASGGGFSNLAHDCVNHFGGTTFPKSKGWTGGLDEVCGKTPRPTSEMRNYSWEQIGWHGRGPWDGDKTYPTGRY